MTNHKRRMRTPSPAALILALLLVAISGYALFQARTVLTGPTLIIDAPQNGELVSGELVVVSGRAENIAFLRLNDRAIFVDEEGRFREPLLLAPGYTILTISAEDRFGRTSEETLELIARPSSS